MNVNIYRKKMFLLNCVTFFVVLLILLTCSFPTSNLQKDFYEKLSTSIMSVTCSIMKICEF